MMMEIVITRGATKVDAPKKTCLFEEDSHDDRK